jgi:thiosulfate/3-mercaptopyruvate sulfurtransferase
MPMDRSLLAEPEELLGESDAVIVDCRFSLADPDEGRALYRQGHIPGAVYLDLNRDLSGPVGEHGGRHPLPDPEDFAATLANCGIGPDTLVIAYDDNRLAFAARLWWLMHSLGYRPPRLLDGGRKRRPFPATAISMACGPCRRRGRCWWIPGRKKGSRVWRNQSTR